MREKLIKEFQKFRKLSSDKDYELLLSDDISFYDYKRLGYILESLKLIDLETELIIKHADRFYEKQKYLNKQNRSQEFFIDWERYNKWLKDFLNNINDEKDREFVKEMFALE